MSWQIPRSRRTAILLFTSVCFITLLWAAVLAGSSDETPSSTYSPPAAIPAPGSRLTADYRREMPAYSVEFKAEQTEYSVEFNAYDAPLRFKPSGFVAGGVRTNPSFKPSLTSADSVEYEGVFGEGIDMIYEIKDNELKESIIIQKKDAIPSESLSSSTASIDFILIYPDFVVPRIDGIEWNSEPTTTSGDIIFIRRREPHKIYAIENFYAIKAPYLSDAAGRIIGLNYTLERTNDMTILRLEIPPVLGSLTYPVTIDPTLYLNRDNDGFMWRNNRSCGTHTSNCTGYIQTDNMDFYIPTMCSPNVEKSLWRFYTSHLGYDYLGSVYIAQLYLKTSTCMYQYMNNNEYVKLYEIVSFQGNPTCGNQIDANVTAQLATVMDKNNCYYGSSGGWVDVKTNFNNSVYNHRNISFKIDVDPIRGESDNPAGNIKYDVNDAQLYIEYYFTCVNSGYCPSSDFCNASGTHLCYTDLPYGAYCEGVAVDNDNYACQNNNCQFDDFDGAGHYCVESNRCVHNGTRYYTGDIHCLGNSWYKTCEGTTWSSQTNCSYGCADGTGCATTTTTTITTTTTTTTTTISGTPNILINPTTLTHRRIV